MKTSLIAFASLAAFQLAVHLQANAAQFQNLDFESPILPLVPDPNDFFQRVPAANALPGWIASIGESLESHANYNAAFGSTAGVGLLDQVGVDNWGFHPVRPTLIEGSYSALLQCGVPFGHPGQPNPSSASLAQIGLVPEGTLSLFLSVDAHVPFFVSLGGAQLSLQPIQVTPDYTVYGANIANFAGQEAELRIGTAAQNFGYLWLDSIRFSPTPVPEPGTLGLFAASLGALGLWHRLRRRR